jgi:RimJ/RimL family protein N-acetyltransferase
MKKEMQRASIEEVQLIPATINDFDLYHEIKSEEHSIYWGGFNSKPDKEKLFEIYSDHIKNKNREILLIKWKEFEAGFVAYKPVSEDLCIGQGINISKKFSGKGLGSITYNKLIEYIKSRYPKCEIFTLSVRDDNSRMQKTITECGFKATNHYTEPYLESDKTKIKMFTWEINI